MAAAAAATMAARYLATVYYNCRWTCSVVGHECFSGVPITTCLRLATHNRRSPTFYLPLPTSSQRDLLLLLPTARSDGLNGSLRWGR